MSAQKRKKSTLQYPLIRKALPRLQQNSTSESSDDSLLNDMESDGGGFEIICDGWGKMRKVKIAKSINEELSLSNFMVYKYVLCKHHQSCLRFMAYGVVSHFLKGAFFGAYASALILILRNQRNKMSYYQVLKLVLLNARPLIGKIGLYSAVFIFLFRLFMCLLRIYFQQSHHKLFPLVAGFFSSALTMPFFFKKAVRKVFMLLSLTLAFECIFKFLFRYRTPYMNNFQRFYRKEIQNGEMVNRCISATNEKRLYKKQRMLDDWRHSNKDEQLQNPKNKQYSFRRKLCEFLLAVVISVVIHTMSFENGGKRQLDQEDFDSPEFDYFNYFFRKIILGNEHDNVKILFQRQDDLSKFQM